MKMIKLASIFTILAVSSLVQANELAFVGVNDTTSLLNSSSTVSLQSELTRLKKQEALLKAIMKKSELIQLKDGSVIDFRDFEGFLPTETKTQTLDGLMEAFMAREGGTGHGG